MVLHFLNEQLDKIYYSDWNSSPANMKEMGFFLKK